MRQICGSAAGKAALLGKIKFDPGKFPTHGDVMLLFPPGDILTYRLSRCVLRDRVGFLRFSILRQGVIFASIGIVFPVLNYRVVKLYELTVQHVNAQLNEKQMIC